MIYVTPVKTITSALPAADAGQRGQRVTRGLWARRVLRAIQDVRGRKAIRVSRDLWARRVFQVLLVPEGQEAIQVRQALPETQAREDARGQEDMQVRKIGRAHV